MKRMYKFYKYALILLMTSLSVNIYAQVAVTGKVTNETEALPGVSILIKNSTTGTQSDTNGSFTISAKKGDVLTFSLVGYATREVTVGRQTALTVKLTQNSRELDNVVVTSFGIKRQERAVGYATSTISAKELTEAGNTNFASALYGKAPGVQITTAPGGSSSAVNIQIRGLNSINYQQQPLFVVDGVILRSEGQYGANGRNNNGFFDDQRIRGNGILDINPQDIESLNVLKGASATALYGSDASSGVVIITTKRGAKGKGPTVDFNYYGTAEQAAFFPKFQNVYGQGYDRETNLAVGASEDGSFPDAASPAGFRPNFRAYANFGPKLEGQKVRWWDGSIQSYDPQPDNYKNIFRTGFSSLANVSLSNQTDNYNYRISASRLDYNSIQRESNQKKTTFSLNSGLKLSKNISVDVVANYINTLTHNRPYQTNRLAQSFDGFFGREEKMNLVLQKFQTSQGYAWVPFNQTARNPTEAFTFNVRPNLYDYFFTNLRNTSDENENRLYSSATLNWDVFRHLKFRGRIGQDYTGRSTDEKNYNQYPVAFNQSSSSTGAYNIGTSIYSIIYGDALLTYSANVTKDFNFSVSGGFTSRSERYKDETSGTSSGLVSENFFSLNNSYGILNTSYTRKSLLKYGFFGIVDLSYKNYLFLEGTLRQEASSTLPPANNEFVYPSVNGSFVFTDAFKLPAFLSYGKLRASYGVVSTPPPIYTANVLYSQSSLQTNNGSVAQVTIPGGTYGNNTLRPEKKREAEVGLETRMFNDRFGIDFTYYQNRIKDVILGLQISPSNGAGSQNVNIGEIGNKGVELGLSGTPVTGSGFRWQTRLNFSFNHSKAYSLAPGIPKLIFYNGENSSIQISVKPNEDIGNIYVRPVATDAKGNKQIDDNGYYLIDTAFKKVGSVLPKIVGGFSNTFSYKNFSLNVLADYKFGSKIVSTPLKYGLNGGMYESTLQYRDAEHGGLSYYVDNNGNYIPVAASNTTGPGGEKVYHDGLIQQGVTSDGKANTKIISAASYYFNEFAAGSDATLNEDGAIYKNDYIKLREVTLSYSLPRKVVNKLHVANIRISVVGRNLLYFYRTLKNLDPETLIGNQWYSQGVDNGSLPATRSLGGSLNVTF